MPLQRQKVNEIKQIDNFIEYVHNKSQEKAVERMKRLCTYDIHIQVNKECKNKWFRWLPITILGMEQDCRLQAMSLFFSLSLSSPFLFYFCDSVVVIVFMGSLRLSLKMSSKRLLLCFVVISRYWLDALYIMFVFISILYPSLATKKKNTYKIPNIKSSWRIEIICSKIVKRMNKIVCKDGTKHQQ